MTTNNSITGKVLLAAIAVLPLCRTRLTNRQASSPRLVVAAQDSAQAGGSTESVQTLPVKPVANPCPRFAAGSAVQNPPTLFSRNGILAASFSYQTTTDADGRQLFCFMTPGGLENPTLHVFPGDRIVLKVTNNTPATRVEMKIDPPNCGADVMTESSVNLHYHGTNTSPTCHQDEVIQTVINSGQTFTYDVHIPADEPPGLYWYHPHIHGLVEHALQGGASGAIVVEGVQNFQPAVVGLTQRILVVRDQNVAGDPMPGGDIPSWDLTLNNIPIAYPDETPAVIRMRPGERQFWRVSNSSADSVLHLEVKYDNVPQPVQIVDFDGVPADSQDGSRRGKLVAATEVLIPTAGRAEFIVKAPSARVKNASLVTLAIDTGPDGDNDPQRTLATIQTTSRGNPAAAASDATVGAAAGPGWKQRFEKLATAKVTAERTLYFSENNPLSQFFITVEGATPTLFDPNNPPAIVTTQGSVEDWTIQNRTLEVHEFHIHQTHFLVLSQNNFEANGSETDPSIQRQFLDTIHVPYWDGNPKHPYPSVKVRIDFRGHDIGDFVYHCHIAEHEDGGMMAIIRVMPAPGP
jgi:FtsP/CotA-like multicopper oxidase with cupredoxin domain